MNILENIDAAIAAWQNVPREKVNLATYEARVSCGTIHCFGGWLPYFEHFQSIGVRADELGAPFIHEDYLVSDTELNTVADLAEYLFGDDKMFYSRRASEYGHDWDIVAQRLQNARAAELARLAQQSPVL